MTGALEKTRVRLGLIPLNDCAPLVAAQEKGFFAEQGLEVELSREASWANIRDKVQVGVLDGAHMLAPMAIASSLGVGGERVAMAVPIALNLNGSAITVSSAVADAMRMLDPEGMAARPRTARPLKRLIEMRRRGGQPPLTFGVVFPYSIHNYELRYWMAAGGVDPDRDVRLKVIPPPRLVGQLGAGEIDGFCVTAPWNALAVHEGLGEILLFSSEWWGLGPDKVFGMRADWAERHPATTQALVRAMLKAAVWADAPENRGEMAAILSRASYVGVPEAVVRQSLVGSPPYAPGEAGSESLDYLVYHRYAASFPWRSHAMWFLSQMVRWGQAGRNVDFTLAAGVYRPDLYRVAAKALGQPAPLTDLKREGEHSRPWTLDAATSPIPMAADSFLDGSVFDPAMPLDYVDRFAAAQGA
ncbi:MAG: CmpA/NrtA family ABC transporter substrate-binding protein [Caulobacteraceae bacterium]